MLEALRQMRINHRGNCRHLLEAMLTSYRLAKGQGEESQSPAEAAAAPAAPAASGDPATETPVPETPAEPGSRPADTPLSDCDSGITESSDTQT